MTIIPVFKSFQVSCVVLLEKTRPSQHHPLPRAVEKRRKTCSDLLISSISKSSQSLWLKALSQFRAFLPLENRMVRPGWSQEINWDQIISHWHSGGYAIKPKNRVAPIGRRGPDPEDLGPTLFSARSGGLMLRPSGGNPRVFFRRSAAGDESVSVQGEQVRVEKLMASDRVTSALNAREVPSGSSRATVTSASSRATG